MEIDIKTVKELAQAVIDVALYPAHNYDFGCRFCGKCDNTKDIVHRPTCLVLKARNILKETENANSPT